MSTGGDMSKATSGTNNTLTGALYGQSIQAGVINGDVHMHYTDPSNIEIVPRQLPPPPWRLVNRSAELAELHRITDVNAQRPATTVLCGPGGVGKTALALHWLHRNLDRYPDGQLYVDLGAESGEPSVLLASVLGRFLRGLGIAGERVPVDAGEAAGLFRSITADKRIAVLVDNAQSAGQILTLMPGCPSSTVVVTSRWQLGGLVLDGANTLILEPLEHIAGVELLTSTLGEARTAAEPNAVSQLIELCGGLPLALSIAGARLAMRPRWPVTRVVQELSDEQRRLAALSVDDAVSVSGVFDVSYDGLSERAARAYRWLAVHPGPDFSVDVAAAILEISLTDSAKLLNDLVGASLLAERDIDSYRFHDLLRLHARQRAEREDTVTTRVEILRRIMGYYLDLAIAADRVALPLEWQVGPRYQSCRDAPPAFANRVEALDSMEALLPHVMAALRAGADAGLDDVVWQLAEAMWSLFLSRKHFPDWIAAYQMGVDAARRCGEDVAQSRMHLRLGLAFYNLHRPEEALIHAEEALVLARRAGHEQAESEALCQVGMTQRACGGHVVAVELLRRAVDLDHHAGRVRSEALARRQLGQTLHAAGQLPEAIKELTLARELMVTLSEARDEALIMVRLANVLTDAGRPEEAIKLLGPAEIVLNASGSSQYKADVLMAWGEAAERLGDLATARHKLEQAHDFYLDAGVPHAERVRGVLARIDTNPGLA